MATKDQQVRHVAEGTALGVLAHGIEAVTSAKLEFELAFEAAWRRWSRAGEFPSISGPHAGNLFWLGVQKSERRQGPRAAWDTGQWSTPYVVLRDWTVEECLDLHADERATVDDWKALGQLFVAGFTFGHIRYAEDGVAR